MYVCMYICMHACMYVCMDVCMYMHVKSYAECAHRYICACVCMYECMFMCVFAECEISRQGSMLHSTSMLSYMARIDEHAYFKAICV